MTVVSGGAEFMCAAGSAPLVRVVVVVRRGGGFRGTGLLGGLPAAGLKGAGGALPAAATVIGHDGGVRRCRVHVCCRFGAAGPR
ncbi:hypothetical protein AB0901_06795, partial [Streptomyces roseifaciens]